jgi:adenylate cyclase
MRGFTTLADSMPASALLELLNRYFDCQVPPILRHGGEVLKFMGDGLLAIFPFAADGDASSVCDVALAAADEMRSAVAALHDWPMLGQPASPRYGLALHLGELLYGNIGAANRLDFTCIGPAVNLASRLQDLAGDLRRTTVLSAEFARHCRSGIVPLGEFALAGFREPQPVYGIVEEAG